jgi:YebC/PmpR family DNA-binding regulatory protein
MSGHSKWAKIKRQKGANDQKRGALFTKLAKNITLAAKEGGQDISMNFALRLAVDKAKIANMPSENIERAIKKASGSLGKNDIQRISYEALGPQNTSFVIDCQTDNTNRTVSEVRKILEQGGAKIANVGSVMWKFNEYGYICVRPFVITPAEKFGASDILIPIDIEELNLKILEIDGVEDIIQTKNIDEEEEYDLIEIITAKNEFANILRILEIDMKLKIDSAELIKSAKDKVQLLQDQIDKIENLIENLEDHDDVDVVWTDVLK